MTTRIIFLAMILPAAQASAATLSVTDTAFWVSADAGVTKDGSDLVSAWADQTPSSTESATNSDSTTTRPLWVSSGLNGMPVLRFDGGDRLVNDRVSSIGGSAVTAFIVANRIAATSNTSTATFFSDGQANDFDNAGSFVLAYEGFSGGTALQTFRGSGKSTATHPGNSSPYVFATVFDGANNTAYLNGTASTVVGSTGTFDIDNIAIGQRWQSSSYIYGYNGDVAELIIYDRALSGSERNAVGYYLQEKYGLASTYMAPSQLINVDIQGASNGATEGNAFGIWEHNVSLENWWNRQNSGASLVDGSGDATGVTFTISNPGGGTAADWAGDALTVDGYYGSSSNGTVTTTIAGLDGDVTYDLIVYHTVPHVSEIVTVTGENGTVYSAVDYTGAMANPGYSDGFDSVVGSNFWYFTGLTADDANQLIITSAGTGYQTITGFQLFAVEPVPEPQSVMLMCLALCGLGLLGWRKKRSFID